MLQTIASFYAKISEKVSLFLQYYMKNTLFVKTDASPITTTRRVLYPFVSITFYYLEKLRNCDINWIHFVSPINTWTVFIPCTSTASMEKLLQIVQKCSEMCREQSLLTKEKKSVDKMPSIAKKRLLRIKFKQHFMSALEKNKSTQTSGSKFAKRNEKVKKNKFELELMKNVE